MPWGLGFRGFSLYFAFLSSSQLFLLFFIFYFSRGKLFITPSFALISHLVKSRSKFVARELFAFCNLLKRARSKVGKELHCNLILMFSVNRMFS